MLLQAETYQRPATKFVAQIMVFGRRERWRRAARAALPLVGGALLTLPIPAVHLFAVPGFLTAATVLGLRRLREEYLFQSVLGPCPACGAELDLRPSGTTLPFTLPCPACGDFLKLSELR